MKSGTPAAFKTGRLHMKNNNEERGERVIILCPSSLRLCGSVSLWQCYPVTNINCNRVCSFCIAAATSVKLSAERAGPNSGSEVRKG
jgi:hypothetical protein